MANSLNIDDVARLMADPSIDNRAKTAEKLAEQFQSGHLSKTERKLAEEIFRVMVSDAQKRVRLALSANLKHADDLSNDIAATLAKDISDDVASPILQFSDALNESDLLEIISSQSADRQIIIAGRRDVTENIANVLVADGDEKAVGALVENKIINLSERTLGKVMDKYGDNDNINSSIVHRAKLPVTIAERLVAKVSSDLQQYLVLNHDLSEKTASNLILQTREKATLSIVSKGEEEDVELLVKQLLSKNNLTPSIILRSLCIGDLMFFEFAMAALSNIKYINVRTLIYDGGALGLKSLYAKTGMPEQIYPAFRSAFDLVMETLSEKSDDDPEIQMRRILERVLTANQDMVDEYGVDNINYLLAKFSKITIA